MIFRFIGIEALVGGAKLTAFGQAIELSETEGAAAIAGNIPMLPEAEFGQIGFTDAELREYGYPGPRQEARPAFLEKSLQARVALYELRERLWAGGTLAGKDGEL